MTDERLAEIRKRAEAATPGKWIVNSASVKTEHPDHQALSHWYNGTTNEVCSLSDGGEYILNTNADNDATFIAAARQDVPKLLAEIERLQSVNRALRLVIELDGRMKRNE